MGKLKNLMSIFFFKCPVAKGIWFGYQWSIRTGSLNINSSDEIVEFILNPPIPNFLLAHGDEDIATQCSIQLVLTLETIWNLRNQVTHNTAQVNLLSSINCLEMRAKKHISILHKEEKTKPCNKHCWKCPPFGVIKLNADAAVANDHTSLAIVARDEQGQVIKAWTKEHVLCEPIQAETHAIFWALELASPKKFQHLIVEGDCKIYFDALNGDPNMVSWSVSMLLSNILD